MQFYFVTTEHLKSGVWFRDEDDFKAGMNFVAIVADAAGVNVLAFILMSNHVHFVLECSRNKAEEFINDFKKRYSMYYQRRYGVKEFLKANKYTIQEVRLDDESAERSIAYTLMNCVAANLCLQCGQYPWGTGDIYFNKTPLKGVPLSSLSIRKQQRLLHSYHRLRGSYLLGDEEYILPASFVKVSFVEQVFRTPKRFNYFLLNSSKAKLRLLTDNNYPSFRDQTIIASVPDLCQSLFHKTSIQELTQNQKSELLKQLQRRFSTDLGQLARVTGIPYPEAAELLESI